jgi:hypothetical protein
MNMKTCQWCSFIIEGAPLTDFLNYIRMNQDKKNYNENRPQMSHDLY